MVYLKGWTSGRSLPILKFVKYPPGSWYPAGLRYVHRAFQSCYRLDHEARRRGQGQEHQMDPFLSLPGRTGLR